MILKTKQLKEALAKLAPIYQTQMIAPVLEHVFIQSDGENVILKASNLRETITMTLENDSSIKPEILLPEYRKLTDFVKLINEPTITLEQGEGVIKITSGKSKASIVSESADAWIHEKEIPEESKVQVDSNVFTRMKDQCLPFVSNDDLKPSMNGLYFRVIEGQIIVQGTDGRNAGMMKLKTAEKYNMEALMPSGFVKAACSLFKDETLEVLVGEGSMLVKGESASIRTRLIDEKFPPLDSVIPEKKKEHLYEVEKSLIVQELKRATIFSNSKSRIVKLSFGKDRIVLRAEDLDYSQEYEGEVSAVGNSNLIIGTDVTQLQKAIEVFDQDVISIYHCGKEEMPIMIVSEELETFNSAVRL